jgi:Fe2+ or Zn2+ uptake regulation protein
MKFDVKASLKKAGFKVTPTREEILKLFSTHNCSPISAEDILLKLKKEKIDRATIYRNLQSFEKAGIIKKVSLQQKADYYELANHHHHHIICKTCGDIEGFKNCNLDSLKKTVLKNSKAFGSITDHSLEFFGECDNCRK